MTRRPPSRPRRPARLLGLGVAIALAGAAALTGSVLAASTDGVHDNGLMELDGSIDFGGNTCDYTTDTTPTLPANCGADQIAPTTAPYDWSSLFDASAPTTHQTINPIGSYTGLVDATFQPYTGNLFTQGSKDTLDVPSWTCTKQANPPKDELVNTYGAAFRVPSSVALPGSQVKTNDVLTDLAIERPNTNGSSNAGFWFFQQPVACNPATGAFSGGHSNNDLFLVGSFQSGGSTALLTAYLWNCPTNNVTSACTGPGSLVGPVDASGGNGLPCPANQSDTYCEVVNQKVFSGQRNPTNWTVLTPWSNIDTGSAGIPGPGFLEMGIDLTAFYTSQGLSTPCFSNFLADTRSSGSSTQASTKDFIGGSFPTCMPSTVLTKSASASTVHVNQSITYTYTEKNTGTDPITNVSVGDDKCPGVTPTTGTDGVHNIGDVNDNNVLDVGETWTFTCRTSFPSSGTYTNTAIGTGTDPFLNQTVTYCSNPASPPANTFCSQTERAQATVSVINPATSLTKTASRTIVHSGDTVTYTYQESNTGDAALTGVSISDDKCSTVTPTLSGGFNVGDLNKNGILDPGETWTYTCSTAVTIAATGTGVPPTVTNTATASGTDPLGNTVTWCANPASPSAHTTCSQTEQAQATVTVLHPSTTLTKTPSASTVYNGSRVTYTYTDSNTGDASLSNVSVSDNRCSPVNPVLATGTTHNIGDTNANGKLDPGETWQFTCSQVLNVPPGTTAPPVVINTATGHGTDATGADVTWCDPSLTAPNTVFCSQSEQASANVTVLHPATSLKKSLSAVVTYTYAEQNTGDTPLTSPSVTDNNCSSVTPVLGADHVHNVGDTNTNGVLDPGETWLFTCQTTITFVPGQTTSPLVVTNTATGTGTDPLGDQVTWCQTPASPPAQTFCSQSEQDSRTITVQ